MGDWNEHRYLCYEHEIIWLVDPKLMPYVRVNLVRCGTRRRSPPKPGTRSERTIVGYAVWKPDAPSDEYYDFNRRVFWLKPYDRYFNPHGTYETGMPIEGIDPLTIAVGIAGEKTDRAWGFSCPREQVESDELAK